MLPGAGYTEVLFSAACAYLARGWSVIPVYGQGDRAKVAAVEWGMYQQRRCSTDEAHRWFMQRGCAGLAVVTGTVSGLAVLDFDDLARFEAFERDHAELTATYTVQTRRGVHLYYKIPPWLTLESRKAPGVDLQSDGRYVIAPPTVIDGHRYQVINNGTPKTLTEADIQRLYAFLEQISKKNAPGAVFAASGSISDGARITSGDVVALYRHLAAKMGRNNALFQVSLRARDDGWKCEDVCASLADLHAGQLPYCQHRSENFEQRGQEAVRTIASAFSRPPRPRRDHHNNRQLPNSIREALFQRQQTFAVRVLEGLRLAGIKPGQTFTTAEAIELLKGKVGRDSIYHALNATNHAGDLLFGRPLPDNPPPATADTERQHHPNKKCLVGNGQKSGKRVFHRPARLFVMPGNLELCHKLGVAPTGSDPLTEADLRSAKDTRQAAHRELIKRRPGMYPRQWLAGRLGVTLRTLHGYNRDIPINVRPMYLTLPITWSSLNRIPADFELAGTFLEDERARRYPPRQEIAARLLAKGHRLVYWRRTANFYSYGDEIPMENGPPMTPRNGLSVVRAHTHSQLPLLEKLERLEVLVRARWADNPLSEEPDEPQSVTDPPAPPPHMPPLTLAVLQQPVRSERRSPRSYRRPLPDSRMEQLAQRVHLETGQGMSVANARRLLDTYGAQPVEFALNRMVWLRRKGKITNPAGFLVVASRLAWRVQNHATGLGMSAPRFRGGAVRHRVKSEQIDSMGYCRG